MNKLKMNIESMISIRTVTLRAGQDLARIAPGKMSNRKTKMNGELEYRKCLPWPRLARWAFGVHLCG
jgi:hypothetical protein